MKTVLITGCSSGYGLETAPLSRGGLERDRHDAEDMLPHGATARSGA